MTSSPTIELDRVSKCYRIYTKPADRLRQMVLGRAGRQYFQEFQALDNVSLVVPRGSCLGILGRNGAGKSTLLQIVSGILEPTSGHVGVSGRVAAILELGAGFNPEFTGRENVYLNASVLGMSLEAEDERFAAIEAFADIGEFLDRPVKTYSSGMMIRLAFAVAIHVDPEILIIDEALAVGDAKFQGKCFRKFEEFREQQKTILFVSHSPDQVARHCDAAVLIERGRVMCEGAPNAVINEYLQLLFGASAMPLPRAGRREQATAEAAGRPEVSQSALSAFLCDQSTGDSLPARPGYNRGEFRWGSRHSEIIDCLIVTGNGENTNHCFAGDSVRVLLRAVFHRAVACPIFGLTIKTPDGVIVYGVNSRDQVGGEPFVPRSAGELATVSFSFTPSLIGENFLLSLGLAEQVGEDVVPLDRRYDVIHFYCVNSTRDFGIADLHAEFEYLSEPAREEKVANV